jgi:hypothetical protein
MTARQGPILYADFHAGRTSGPVVRPDALGEANALGALIQRHGGESLDPFSQRLTAAFFRYPDALLCAHDVRALAQRVGAGRPAEARPVCRILLAHGPIPAPGSLDVPKVALALATRIARVPADSISSTEEFLGRLPHPPPAVALPGAAPGATAARVYLLAAAGIAITPDEKTREMAALAPHAATAYTRLTLRVGMTARQLAPADCPLTIGRDRTCGLLLQGPDVSRVHGRVTHAKGKFVYSDASRNGSFVTIPGGTELHVHNESLMLVGQGVISPGLPAGQQTGDVLEFDSQAAGLPRLG